MNGESTGIHTLRIRVSGKKVTWDLQDVLGNEGVKLIATSEKEQELDSKPYARERIEKVIGILRDLGGLLRKLPGEAKVGEIANRVAETLGEELYEYLFVPDLDRLYHAQLKQVREKAGVKKLRVSLELLGSDVEQISRWPWEYLRSRQRSDVEHSGHYLAVDPDAELVLSRCASRLSKALTVAGTLKVLLIVSRPRNRDSVQYDAVFNKLTQLQTASAEDRLKHGYTIRTELKDLVDTHQIEPNYLWQVTRQNVRTVIRAYRPQIVHLIGHGSFVENTAKIDLVQLGGLADPTNAKDFVDAIYHSDLKLVFLQACESALADPYTSASGIAGSLANKNIPAVIAMSDRIENEVASEFACGFYERLAQTGSIDGAVNAGRTAIELLPNASQRIAFGVPVLYLDNQSGMFSLAEVPSSGGPSRTVVDTTRRLESQTDRCPRCGDDLRKGREQKGCSKCGLRFVCESPKCQGRIRLANPMEGKYCDECGEAVTQREWLGEPTEPSPPPRRNL